MPHPKEDVIPVTEEELEVRRERVETGAVRIHKAVEEVPVRVVEPLVTDSVHVERVPIGRVVAGPLALRQEGDVTIVPVVEERLVRQWVLVEEVHVTRERVERAVEGEVVLRRDRVDVERREAGTDRWLPEERS